MDCAVDADDHHSLRSQSLEKSVDDNDGCVDDFRDDTMNRNNFGRQSIDRYVSEDEEHVNFIDEKERVQKKVFTNWINNHVPNCIQSDIIGEMRDGTKLIALIEALSGAKLPVERGRRLRRHHFMCNVSNALDFLQSRGLKLVNIHAPEIVDGNPRIILGLIWHLILRFHIEEYIRLANEELESQQRPPSALKDFSTTFEPTKQPEKLNVRRNLLDNLNRQFDVNVNDFGPSWRDGYAFLTLIDAIMPQLRAVQKGRGILTNRGRLQLAFDLAEEHLGINRLFDPDDIDVEKPDERSIMTYVSQFLRKPRSETGVEREEETIEFHEPKIATDVITKWVALVMSSGITALNIARIEEEADQLRTNEFEKVKHSLDPQTLQNWYLIDNQLKIGKRINDWNQFATKTLQSYKIPTSAEEVIEQLSEHRKKFDSIPHFGNTSPLLQTLIDEYNECLRLIKEWETAMTEASKRWSKYNASKENLVSWLVKGEELLQKAHDPTREDALRDFQTLKEYFSDESRNEAILFRFIADCDDVFETLPETHQSSLREVLKSLETRFRDITKHRAPMHLIRFEFHLIEADFDRKLKDGENEAMLLDDLQTMEKLANDLWQKFNDNSLLDRVNEYRKQLDARKAMEAPKHEIAMVRRNTLGMIYETQTNIEMITIRTRIEIIKDSEEHIKQIRLRTQVLRRLSVDHGVDVSEDLSLIESHLTKLDSLLEEKKKEKVNYWLQEEAPLRLREAKSMTEIEMLREEMTEYKRLVSESELVKKVDVFEAETKLAEIEKCRVDSIPEAEDKIEELKQLNVDDPKIKERIDYLESRVLEQWKSIVDHKGVLQDWIRNKSLNASIDRIKTKEAEVLNVIDRFNRCETILRTFASDLAVNELKRELLQLKKNYSEEIEELIRFNEKMKQKQETIDFLNSVETWLNSNPIESIVPDEVSTFDEALPIITNKQLECQKLKDELQFRIPDIDEDLKPRATHLLLRLNGYDWNLITSNQNSKFAALQATINEMQRLKDQLQVMAQLIDNLESKLTAITSFTDSLGKKRSQLEVSQELLRQIESIKIGDFTRNEVLEDDYKAVMERFRILHRKLVSLVEEKRLAFEDHLKFNELCDKFIAWMKTLRDIIPPIPEDAVNFDIFTTSLSNLLSQRSVGDYKLAEINNQGAIAAEKSSDPGKAIINNTVDVLKKDYNSLFNEINKIYEDSKQLEEQNLQAKHGYNELLQWLYDVKCETKMLPLQKTLNKKADQLNDLEAQLKTVKSKENDVIKAKAFEAQNKHQTGDIETLFAEVLVAIQFQISRWKNYVSHHTDFDASLNAAKEINNRMMAKVKEIETIGDPHEQLTFIDNLLSNVEEDRTFRKTEDQLRVVITETATEGADVLTKIVKQTIHQRDFLKTQILNLKKVINEQLSKKQKYDNLLERIKATLDSIESEAEKIVCPSGSLEAKATNFSKAKTLLQKCESIGIYEFPVIPEIKDEFEVLLSRYNALKGRLEKLKNNCENGYNQHLSYNEAKDKFDNWIDAMKEAIPSLSIEDQRNLGALRRSLQVHNNIKEKKAEGIALLDELKNVALILMQLSDEKECDAIKNDLNECESKLKSLFSDIEKNCLFLNDSVDTLEGKSDVWTILQEVENWIKNNPRNELLPEKCFTSISEALDDMELKKVEWQQQRDKLKNVYEALQTGDHDEEAIEKYAQLWRQIEAYDWDKLIREFSEKLRKLIEFVESGDDLRNIVKQIHALIDIIYYNSELSDLIPLTDSLENKKRQFEFIEEVMQYICGISLEDIPQREVLEDESESIRTKLEKFKEKVKRLAKEKQKAFNDHFMFQKSCSSFIAWLRVLKQKIPSIPSDGTNVEEYIASLTDLQSQRTIGEKKLQDVKQLCGFVLQNTSENGTKIINVTLESLEKAFTMIVDDIDANVEKSKKFKYETLKVKASLYQRLSDWLLSLENEVKELPLKSTSQEKQEHLSKLKLLEEELLSKESGIKSAVEKGKKEMNSETINHLNDIDQRYKNLVISIREQVSKWTTIANNHTNFDHILQSMKATGEKMEKRINEIEAITDKELRLQAMSVLNFHDECDELIRKGNLAIKQLKDETASAAMDDLTREFEEQKSRLKTLNSKIVDSKERVTMEHIVPQKHDLFSTLLEESDFENRSRGSSVASDRSAKGSKAKELKAKAKRAFKLFK